MQHTHTHIHVPYSIIPYSLFNVDSPSSNSTFFCFSHSHYTKIIPLASRSIIGTKPSVPCKSTISLFVCLHSHSLSVFWLLSSLVCTQSYGLWDGFWRVHSVLVSLSKEVHSCFPSYQKDVVFCWGVIHPKVLCVFLLCRGLEMLIANQDTG